MLANPAIHLEQLIVPSLSKVGSLLMEGINHEPCDFSKDRGIVSIEIVDAREHKNNSDLDLSLFT